jgi:septal ring factor EnvC (AmiA/AmiB activator)
MTMDHSGGNSDRREIFQRINQLEVEMATLRTWKRGVDKLHEDVGKKLDSIGEKLDALNSAKNRREGGEEARRRNATIILSLLALVIAGISAYAAFGG